MEEEERRKCVYVCVCVGGEGGQEEVSNYLPPPLPLMLSPGFISPRHLQIKFVLRRRIVGRGGRVVWREASPLCSIRAAGAPEEPDDKPDAIMDWAGACVSLCVCVCVCVRWG